MAEVHGARFYTRSVLPTAKDVLDSGYQSAHVMPQRYDLRRPWWVRREHCGVYGEGGLMRGWLRIALLTGLAAMVPWTALAQGGAALTGVARDESGAVLPGVVVEASSPVLIEKTRSSVTDGTGRYVILDLRPGTYTVTFTLTGFATGKRENGIVSGTGSITLDTPMKLGNVAETVTVTGETPTVDIQTTTRETVMDQAIVAAIPTSRNSFAVGVLIPGVTVSDGFGSFQDVGGALGPTTLALMVHGSRVSDQRQLVNGVA